jgi:molybdopterin converting factor small subunit
MQVKVRFLGLFSRYVGERERVFDITDGSTAADLLLLIGNEYGARLPANFFDKETGRFHKSVHLARSGGAIDEDAELHDSDELLVLFSLAGG